MEMDKSNVFSLFSLFENRIYFYKPNAIPKFQKFENENNF